MLSLLILLLLALTFAKRQGMISNKKFKTYQYGIFLLLALMLFGIKAILLLIIVVIILYFFSKERPFEKQTFNHNHYAANPNNKMTYEEALKIFGLSGSPNESEIKIAYKKLITKYHPDVGGSDYFAAKINQAKKILLNE